MASLNVLPFSSTIMRAKASIFWSINALSLKRYWMRLVAGTRRYVSNHSPLM
jgi:hypothetical protein